MFFSSRPQSVKLVKDTSSCVHCHTLLTFKVKGADKKFPGLEAESMSFSFCPLLLFTHFKSQVTTKHEEVPIFSQINAKKNGGQDMIELSLTKKVASTPGLTFFETSLFLYLLYSP